MALLNLDGLASTHDQENRARRINDVMTLIKQNQGLKAWLKSIPGPIDTKGWGFLAKWSAGCSLASNLILGSLQSPLYWLASLIISPFRYFRDLKTNDSLVKSSIGWLGTTVFGLANLLIAQPLNVIGHAIKFAQAKVDNVIHLGNNKLPIGWRISFLIPIALQKALNWFQPPEILAIPSEKISTTSTSRPIDMKARTSSSENHSRFIRQGDSEYLKANLHTSALNSHSTFFSRVYKKPQYKGASSQGTPAVGIKL